jgi:uncharacterized membrane protein
VDGIFAAPTVKPEENDLQSLRALVSDLVVRIERLERQASVEKSTPAEPVLRPEAPPPLPPTQEIHAHPAAPDPLSLLAASAPQIAPTANESDLESRIGSQWLNRIGISAVLIGVSYFLKFAFDNNWVGPTGRVSIGLLGGIAVVIWSENFRKRDYKIFSYSLKALGVGVLYLSLWAAFQVYSLIPSPVAFLAMVIITAATATLAIKQDAEILAALALTGGFATPLLLSTEQNREVELFSYIALLGVASVALVMLKPWRRLVLGSYSGTLLLYIAWYSEYYRRNEFAVTFVFATVFFAIFVAATLLAKIPENASTVPFLMIALTLINSVVYFLQAYAMVDEIDKQAMAWFALALAGVHIGLSRIIARQETPNLEPLRLLHLTLAVVLITIAIPIRLDGHWITVGWLVEAGVLVWLADRIGSRLIHYLSAVALALGVARLLAIDNFVINTLLLNARMGIYVLAIAVLALLAHFSLKGEYDVDRQIAATAVLAINVLALVGLSREIGDYYARQMPGAAGGAGWRAEREGAHRIRIAEGFTYSALWMGYGALLMVIGFWTRSAFFRWQALFLIAATIIKVFLYDVSELDRGYRILSFIILGVLLLSVSFVYQKDWLKLSLPREKEEGREV